jgi:peptidyl-prolyl cis-trans isomerase SurA
MRKRIERRSLWQAGASWLVLLACFLCVSALGQDAQPVELDHVVAVVGEQAILQSDVEDEIRFTAMEAGSLHASEDTPQSALSRLIDRALIDRERSLQPGSSTITEQQVQASLASLKKNLPACAHAACATAAGWSAVLRANGFTPQQIEKRMQERLQILQFIQWRFGSTIRISHADEDAYYKNVLAPQFAQNHIAVPPLAKLSARIREILLQQKISVLLEDWLKSLRAEDEVHIVDPAYAGQQGEQP